MWSSSGGCTTVNAVSRNPTSEFRSANPPRLPSPTTNSLDNLLERNRGRRHSSVLSFSSKIRTLKAASGLFHGIPSSCRQGPVAARARFRRTHQASHPAPGLDDVFALQKCRMGGGRAVGLVVCILGLGYQPLLSETVSQPLFRHIPTVYYDSPRYNAYRDRFNMSC